MDTRGLCARLKARGWSQSELARRVGVTRQAVSLWCRSEHAQLRGEHLVRLAQAFGEPVESLFEPLPTFGDAREHERLRTSVLWDRLFPDLDDFCIAVGQWQPGPVGRFVQVFGLYRAEKVLGDGVWKRFAEYAPHIHPVRRAELEGLVRWKTKRQAAN